MVKKSLPVDNNVKNKTAALQQAVGQIEKQHGKGSIMRLGKSNVQVDIPVIPTGSLALDLALGVGGFPKGRIIEIYGPESSGKTTLALHAIANVQKQGGIAVLIDAEYAFDAVYAKNLGVDIDNLLVSQPDTGEQALEIADTLVRSGAIDIIVVDSVAALVPAAEIEGEPVGGILGLPDYNPRIKAINGRLFPFGFIKLLSKKRDLTRIRKCLSDLPISRISSSGNGTKPHVVTIALLYSFRNISTSSINRERSMPRTFTSNRS